MSLPPRSPAAIGDALRAQGVLLHVSPFLIRLRSPLPAIADGVALFYDQQVVADDGGQPFADFHIRIAAPRGLRRWFRPQVNFHFDNLVPFKPLPACQAFPFFEWGLNWCIAQHAHHYHMIHAAVVERGGRALILPGQPGSGKSTLCAALVNRGWRLLSDEFALVDHTAAAITPLPRPVSLKNESIAVIRAFAREAVIGPATADTAKGTVAHMKPPAGTVAAAATPAAPGWVIFPGFEPGAPTRLATVSKGRALMQLIKHSFNYNILGARGFESAADLIDASACFELSYGDLEDVTRTLDALVTAVG